MNGYKFKYTGAIGTEVVTANCASGLFFAISNGGDSDATVKLFKGETEISKYAQQNVFPLPTSEYSLFEITTPATPTKEKYTATITGSESNPYTHKIDIMVDVVDSSNFYYPDLHNAVFKATDVDSIGYRVFRMPLNSTCYIGVDVSNDDEYYRYLSCDNTGIWNNNLLQTWTNPLIRSSVINPINYGMITSKLNTGIEPCKKEATLKLLSKHRTITNYDLSSDAVAIKYQVTTKDGNNHYFARGDVTDYNYTTLYALDENDNITGYATYFYYRKFSLVTVRPAQYAGYDFDKSTIIGNFPDWMPMIYAKGSKSGSVAFAWGVNQLWSANPTELSSTISLAGKPHPIYEDNPVRDINVRFEIEDGKEIVNQDTPCFKFDFDDMIGDNVLTMPEGQLPQYLAFNNCGDISATVDLENIDTGEMIPCVGFYDGLPGYFCSISQPLYFYFPKSIYGTQHFKATIHGHNPDETPFTKSLTLRIEHKDMTQF